jgi:excinuclease ABC subunit A
MVDLVASLKEETRIIVLAPVVRGRKGEYHQLLYDLYKGGFARVRVNGEMYGLTDTIKLDRYKAHTIEVVVDRLIIGQSSHQRLTEAMETAIKLSKGLVIIAQEGSDDELMLSEDMACPYDGFSLGEISSRSFSFNSPYGACVDCHGLGYKKEVSELLVIPDDNKTIAEGGIMPWTFSPTNYYGILIKNAAEHFGMDIDTPIKNLDKQDLTVWARRLKCAYATFPVVLLNISMFGSVASFPTSKNVTKKQNQIAFAKKLSAICYRPSARRARALASNKTRSL